MIDKLKCDIPSMELMDYIGVVESLYLSDPTLIDVPYHITDREPTEEELEEIRNCPFGFTMCMGIFKDRYNNGGRSCAIVLSGSITGKIPSPSSFSTPLPTATAH